MPSPARKIGTMPMRPLIWTPSASQIGVVT
jgi:hypothetical protein